MSASALPRVRRGIGGHQSGRMESDVWLTPPHIIESLGPFDLDPCSPIDRPWDTARRHLTILDDGLSQPWSGRVWMNPPYGRETAVWMRRIAAHGDGIALIFARTETVMFFESIWGVADAVLFLEGRLHFHRTDGTRARANSGAPSCLIAYGEGNVRALRSSGLAGHLVSGRVGRQIAPSADAAAH